MAWELVVVELQWRERLVGERIDRPVPPKEKGSLFVSTIPLLSYKSLLMIFPAFFCLFESFVYFVSMTGWMSEQHLEISTCQVNNLGHFRGNIH